MRLRPRAACGCPCRGVSASTLRRQPIFTLRVTAFVIQGRRLRADSHCELCQELQPQMFPEDALGGRLELWISCSRQPAAVRASAASSESKPGSGRLVRTNVRRISRPVGATHGVPEMGEGRGPQSWQDPLHVAASVIVPELRQDSFPRRSANRGGGQPCSLLLHEGVEGRPAVRRDEVQQALAVLWHREASRSTSWAIRSSLLATPMITMPPELLLTRTTRLRPPRIAGR